MSPDEVAAHVEIQQVLFRYCRGVDRGDRAVIASVYHDDANDDHGTWKGRGKDFGEYLVPAMDGSPLSSQHHITNSLIEVDGEVAHSESYFIAFHPLTGEDGRPFHAFVCGRYLDRFALRGGAWKIADRRVVIDIARNLDPGQPWPAAGAFLAGARRDADPSFEWFRGA